MRRTGEGLPFDQILRIMRQILAALHFLHEHKIIHRDVKPVLLADVNLSANILEDSAGIFKISDFGMSVKRPSDCRDNMSVGIGTPLYRAPEILFNNYSEKIDIYR